MVKTTGSSPEKIDGRTTRSERSRQSILRAYMELVSQTRRQPTALQIAERAGCSLRLIFQHFSDLPTLTAAAVRHGYDQGIALAAASKAEGDRRTRISAQVGVRAHNCETWLPLWSIAMDLQGESSELRRLVGLVRKATIERLAVMYAPELASSPDVDRRRILIALDAVTDFKSWDRLRGDHGFSVEQARALWTMVVDRLLPSTPVGVPAAKAHPTSGAGDLGMPLPGEPPASASQRALAL